MGQHGDFGRAGYSQPEGGDNDQRGWPTAVPEPRPGQYPPPAVPEPRPPARPAVPRQFQPQSQFRPGPQFTPAPQFTPGANFAPPPQPATQAQYAPAPQYPLPPAGGPRQRGRHLGRKIIGGIVGLVAVIIVIGIATSSGGHSVKTSGTTAADGGAGTKAARIGSAITLAGVGAGEQVTVTVVKVIATAEPADEFSGASVGKRLYAVQFRLKNTGRTAYSDAPSNGAAVVDTAGQSYNAQLAGNAVGCPSFSAPENIAAGSSGLGCVTFDVPATAKITQVQFTLDSGLGPETGQWASVK
jgi:Domain of unknown function (DUF4352)